MRFHTRFSSQSTELVTTIKLKVEMWANAQRDGRRAECRTGGALCSMPQSVADAQYSSAVQ